MLEDRHEDTSKNIAKLVLDDSALRLLHPEHTTADSAAITPQRRWARIERILAGFTIVNALVGLLVSLMADQSNSALPLLSLLGLLSGALVWRRHAGGHGAGLLFYALQLVGYHSYDAIDIYPLRSILSLAYVVHLPAGVLIVNLLALAMIIASAALLRWPYGRPGA